MNLQSENISCTKDEMKRAAEGHLTTEALMWNQNNQKTISGMSSEDFRSVMLPGFSFHPFLYAGLCCVIIRLSATRKIPKFTTKNRRRKKTFVVSCCDEYTLKRRERDQRGEGEMWCGDEIIKYFPIH